MCPLTIGREGVPVATLNEESSVAPTHPPVATTVGLLMVG